MGCMDGGMISVRITLLVKHFLEKISCEEKSLRMMDKDLDWMNG